VLKIRTAGQKSTTKAPGHEDSDERSQKLEARSEKSEVADAKRMLRIRTAVGDRESGDSQHGLGTRSEVAGRGQSPALEAPRSGTVPVTSVMSRRHVRIEIADTGVGVPQKYLDKVFEPYFTHGKPDGTGLGLALAKKIVEEHRGHIEIHSKEGSGTTVSIVLPAEKEHG
jgi:signal transduction histidine kinase